MSLEDFFERLKNQYTHKLPFVVYRKPHKTIINGLLQNSKQLVVTHDFTERGFVFSPFDNEDTSVLIPEEASELITTNDIQSLTEGLKLSHLKNTTNNEKGSKESHMALVNKGKRFIEKAQVKKIVLSRRETVLLKEKDPLIIFTRLLQKYPSAFVYCWYHPEVGLWLGATPETLVKIEGTQFSIMALAGTQNYEGHLDVTWREKEIQEQQYVTDYILNRIENTVDNIQVSKTETVKAANLVHLRTKIWGALNRSAFSLKDFLYHLHPTPAVCGLPKDQAKDFIQKHEGYNRRFYTGFLGELNLETVVKARQSKRNIENRAYNTSKTSTQLYVNLRCVELQGNHALIYVGGGITAYSDAEEEWQETVSKALVIKSVL